MDIEKRKKWRFVVIIFLSISNNIHSFAQTTSPKMVTKNVAKKAINATSHQFVNTKSKAKVYLQGSYNHVVLFLFFFQKNTYNTYKYYHKKYYTQ